MAAIIAPPGSQHLIEVVGTGDDQTYRIVCPDGGKNCQSAVECTKEHRCDCGPHPHDDKCDEGCAVDHAEECDEWLYRNDGLMHGEHHLYAGGVICVHDSACWMSEWDIEFTGPEVEYTPGLYEFDYDHDSAFYNRTETLDVTAMRRVTS